MTRLLGGLLALLLVLTSALPAAAQTALSPGALIGLSGTPHLWIADESGVLHWAGDTRALAGKTVNWGSRRDVSLNELLSLRRGAPWLSAGLLKEGDPIYFVKWETSDASPTLLHIQSIADVELFGIDGANYGQYVLDRSAWERQFGLSAGTLSRGTLASAVTVSQNATAPAATAPATVRGLLASALTTAERTAFFESVRDSTSTGRATKWARAPRVELRRSSFASHGPLVDDIIAEVNSLVNGLGLTRVASSGDIVIDFVPLAELSLTDPDALGYAEYFSTRTGAMGTCQIVVAHDPQSAYGSRVRDFSPQMMTDLLGLVVRHEFGHCLGLGHNQSTESFMSYRFSGLNAYYTGGSRAARFNDFDRALIRTLYHSAILPGMPEATLKELFGI